MGKYGRDLILYISPLLEHTMKRPAQPYPVVSTVSNVITAFCLVALTTAFIVGGMWTAQTVTELQHTYHPDKISVMITELSETVGMIHTLVQNTTHHTHLKSSQGSNSHGHQAGLLEDLHLLATSLDTMTSKLDMVPTFINEAHEWRYMTTDAYAKFKSVMTSL